MASAGAAPEEDPGKASRVVGRRYRHNRRGEGLGVVEIWTGSRWLCDHGRERNRCKECGGASICEDGRVRSQCKECGGASICEHGRERSVCKACGGSQICEHAECGDGARRARARSAVDWTACE